MRELTSVMLAAAILAAFACVIVLGDRAESTSVDEYISASRGEVKPVFDPRFPADPRSSRRLWEERKESSTDSEMESPPENISEASPAPVVEGKAPEISGRLSFVLKDLTSKRLELQLYRLDDTVFGHGTISENSSTQQVSAIGDVMGSTLELDAISEYTIYRLKIDSSKSPMTGTFTAYRADASSWPGVVYQEGAA
ncbi:MAG TPA: hypothetical protein PK659_00135 [Methanothrix sp.]|nr:hypothetical protein [Methanothrix sp.]HOK57496.1 hypothetical protein [Methanothrix sp.]HOL42649.1 hypothetical protein [Methanothrix sp.]HPO87781.1 hypothetical protein [Methanothrix sp.]